MKKIGLFLWLSLNLFLLAGCWDRTEVNDLALVSGIALDKKEDKGIELTIEMPIPKLISGGQTTGGGGGKGGTLTRSGEGTTIADAISNLQEKIPRKLFWGHTKVIVISEKLAEEGIREPLDFLARHSEPRLRSYLFVSKGKAKDVMALQSPLERSPGEVLRELAKFKVLKETTLKEILQSLVSDARTASVPMIDIMPPQKGNSKLETIGYINRTSIFKKDKMIGDIDDRLTRGVLWIINEIEQAHVTMRPEEAKGGYISSILLRSHTDLLPQIKNGKWMMTVKVRTEDDLILNGTNLNLMNPKLVHMLEKELKKTIENRIQETLQEVQKEMKADIFGFADAFHRKYPEKWANMKDNWDEIYSQMEVKVEVNSYIRRPGLSTNPQGLPEEEVQEE